MTTSRRLASSLCVALWGTGTWIHAASEPVHYTLVPESVYQHGCFPPCMCPVMVETKIGGTFDLTPTGSDGLFDHYDVTNVEWVVKFGDSELSIEGEGTYQVGGEVALQERLELKLSTNGQAAESFDSGWVAGGGEFPAIVIAISIHGGFCLDTVIDVVAKPVPVFMVHDASLSWDAVPGATSYDLVRGDLETLVATDGNFTLATEECLASHWSGTELPYASVPPENSGHWFLLRVAEPAGSYDSGYASQVAPRDAAIDAAPAACP